VFRQECNLLKCKRHWPLAVQNVYKFSGGVHGELEAIEVAADEYLATYEVFKFKI
jgi:hypothetical protein